ncbi:histidine--tRNA ligase [Candidatus Parcubacteria bacterium]|nr:MAG: histidine--tRNA ligase [Candidatus Parcubacteria bacterium]
MDKSKIIQAPKGTFDILPTEQKYWEKVRRVVALVGAQYGFERIDTPIFEGTDLFERSVGQETDIVEKQMYTFKTKGKDSLTLRPEGTASVVRSYIENGLNSWPQPVRLYYVGPMFRYEQPQSERYRQFHQFGFELIGDSHPIYDAWLINIALVALRELGLHKTVVAINSIGDAKCRPVYRKALVAYYKNKVGQLCEDCKRRYKTNPLRLLDCKEHHCSEVAAKAPNLVDHLCEECRNHFKSVLEYLDEQKISYMLNPHLVRGLDYYTKTVFQLYAEESLEILSGNSNSHKNPLELGGGGRYDMLAQQLGGKNTPALGFAMGIERIISLMRKNNIKVSELKKPEVFLVQLGELGRKKSLTLFEKLREGGIDVVESFGRDNIKSQLRAADKIKVRYAVIVGQKEALEEAAIIREMTSGTQETIPFDKIVNELKKRLRQAPPVSS